MTKIRKKRTSQLSSDRVGRMVLPEDSRMVHNACSMKAQPRRTAAPRISGKERVSRTEVGNRLMTAMQTLRAVPDRERRFFVPRSSSPDYIRSYIDAYDPDDDIQPRFQPTPFDVSDYLTALSWVRHLDKHEWKILWWRSFGLSFGVIGKQIGRSDETARMRYENAVTEAWISANKFP